MTASALLPTAADVDEAARRLAGVALHTPLLTSAALDAMTGGRVFLKAETLQRTGSFKFRGAYNKLAAIPPERRAGGVVAFSSGNHAQGVAAAARLLGTHFSNEPGHIGLGVALGIAACRVLAQFI